jgi:hypothetical protein
MKVCYENHRVKRERQEKKNHDAIYPLFPPEDLISAEFGLL